LSERQIVCEELGRALDDLRREGFRVDLIYPADEPHTAFLSKGADSLRLTSRPDAPPIPDRLPPFAPGFVLARAGASPADGRAGMLYRDLIPSRLGGRYVASRISIPRGGPVADWVHFHRISLQMLYVRRGWVRVVYEDQGEPFAMREGDLVLQPPEIRHRVIESSDGFEIVEISAPAVHATYADHHLALPNGTNVGRLFAGQRFLHHIAAETPWTPFGGGEAQETAMGASTGGLAHVRTIRRGKAARIDFPAHEGELVFGFVLDGSGALDLGGKHAVAAADAFVIPPGEGWGLADLSPDLRLLHVTTARLG
jgi:quercetin dioxygenase-like cupin family protein